MPCRSRHPVFLVLTTALCVSAAHAQSSFLVPTKALQAAPDTTWADDGSSPYPFNGGNNTRTQFFYDVAEIPTP